MGYDITNFEKEVLERSHTIPVVVDFWAEWCGPCKVLGPVLERLAAKADGRWMLAKVDTEQHTEVARTYGIQSIPNVKLFIDGAAVNEFVGALPEYQILRWLETAIPGKHQKQIDQAEALLASGNHAAAKAALETVLSAEPGNAQARIFLARSIVFEDPVKAIGLIESIEEPKYSDLMDAIRVIARLLRIPAGGDALPSAVTRDIYLSAIHHLVASDFDAALGQFIGIIRQDRYYDNDGSRKACIALFKLLGEEHPLTQKHRRDFSSALY
jgi:putative thioredoxin